MNERRPAEDPLSRLLLAADPVRRQPGLTPTEVARLRARTRTSANARARRARARGIWPALGVAAALLVVAILGQGKFTDRVSGGDDVARRDAAAVAPSATAPEPARRIVLSAGGTRLAPPTPLRPRATLAARYLPAGPRYAAGRDLHFTAPDGTRIVWDLGATRVPSDDRGADVRS